MDYDLIFQFIQLFLIGSGFGIVVGLLILWKSRVKKVSSEEENLSEEPSSETSEEFQDSFEDNHEREEK